MPTVGFQKIYVYISKKKNRNGEWSVSSVLTGSPSSHPPTPPPILTSLLDYISLSLCLSHVFMTTGIPDIFNGKNIYIISTPQLTYHPVQSIFKYLQWLSFFLFFSLGFNFIFFLFLFFCTCITAYFLRRRLKKFT